MRRNVRVRLSAFAVLAAVIVSFTGVRYAQVTDRFLDTRYLVTADLGTSGGLFAGAEVTYRGVPVGRVEDVRLAPDGVSALLAIRNKWHIPEDVVAHVRNRSAVGEQYIDLTPFRAGAPYLRDGSIIERARTTTPLPEEELITTVDTFVQSVNVDDLRTVVSELGKGFRGSGRDLQRLLDGSSTFVEAANENLPATIALLEHTTTVLQTQADGASNIRSFADSLAKLTDTLRFHDADLRGLLEDGAPAARELTGLVNGLALTLPRLVADMIQLGGLTVPRLGGISHALAILPYDLAIIQTFVRDGRSALGLAFNHEPAVCQKGYVPPSEWRSVHELEVIPPTYGVRCAERGKNYRGSAYAAD
ncbi:MAG TPA: MlaD family protein [Nocardioidaceae bacterium]|nr:MlaD family protein [Nocardioidaceae bacterium]